MTFYFLIPILTLFISEVIKFILAKNKQQFLRTGGMPSSHSAVMASALTIVILTEGISSSAVVIGTAIAGIVWYDAIKIRPRIGLLNKEINKITASTNLDETVGHTLKEVCAGIALGCSIAATIFFSI